MTHVQRPRPAFPLSFPSASVLTAVLLVSACGSEATGGPTTESGVGTAGAKAASSAGTTSSAAGKGATAGTGATPSKPATTPTGPIGTGTTGAAGAKPNAGDVTDTGSAGKAAPAGGAPATGTSGAAGAPAAAGGGAPTTTTTTTGTPDMSAGCGKTAPATPPTSIMVGSSTGALITDVPKDYDSNKPYPLVMVWHGAGVTNTAFHGYLNVQAVAGAEAIIVTPECLDGGSNWPSDMSYPDAIMEQFEANYCIDKKRIFTTGHSMGGFYTAAIGCQRADKFRADAVLAASHNASGCVKGNMAAMMSVGQDDFAATAATEFAYWSMYGGCDQNMKNMVDPMSFYKGALDEMGSCIDYGGCKAETPVRTCTFEGGHEIPPWVAGAVWDFFKKL